MSKLVIGLIGGIGSGKSLVAATLAKRGARVISGDQIGHEALRQPEIRGRLIERWGLRILDERGEVDRRQMAALVFADVEQRRALEAIVHPWIGQRLQQEIAAAQADPAVVLIVLDAAIMLEANWTKLCDKLIFVDAPRAVRLERLAEQRGWAATEMEARENAQMPLTEKAKHADAVLVNSGSPEALALQVDHLLQHLGMKLEK